MPNELNTPDHRYYQPRYNIPLAKEDISRLWIYASGISKIDAWIDLLSGRDYSILGLEPLFVTDFDDDNYRVQGAGTTFASAITHSRAGNATMVDSDGLLKWAPHNLFAYSEDFSNAAWAKSNVTATPNVATAPDGTQTADRVVGTGVWLTYQAAGNFANCTISIWAKSNTGSDQTFRFITNSSQTSSNLTVTSEWQLFEFEQTATGSNTGWGLTRDSSNSDVDILIWGAHLYRSDLGGMVDNPDRGDSYVPTTSSAVYLPRRGHHVYNGSAWVNEGLLHESEARTNLVLNSGTLSDWTLSRMDSPSQDAVGPDGDVSALMLVDDASGGAGQSQIFIPVTVSNSTPYTFSVFLKAGANTWVSLRAAGFTTPASGNVWFDLSEGAVGTEDAGLKGLIQDVGNGWFRCSVSFTTDAADTSGNIIIELATSDNNRTVTLDGSNSVFAYGAQLEAGSTPSSYIPTSGATVTRAAETLTVPAANLPWPEPVVIGDELVTNGTFDSDLTGWTDSSEVDGSISWDDGGYLALTTGATNANEGKAKQTLTTTAGGLIQINFDVVSGGGLVVGVSAVYGVGSHSMIVHTPSSSYDLILRNFSNTNGTTLVDNISVREINPLSVSIQMDGRMTYADTGLTFENVFFGWNGVDTTKSIFAVLDTGSVNEGRVQFRQYVDSVVDLAVTGAAAYSPSINVPFSIASRHGSTFINGAVDGTALTADTTPVALPDLSATDLQLGYDFNGTISLFRIWSDDIGDVGISEASA